ncbi:MAG: hypothetical protein MI862_08195 [Desulfobacterales bacterium]|nr:hypothetical protein [Desulfobacterales bacterium]
MATNLAVSKSNLCYLEFMKDIYEVSNICSTKTYVWGGFTLDIFEGEFLREHSDLDCFILNMMSVLNKLITEYEKRGYKTEFKSDYNNLVIRKEDHHASFNPLDVDGEVAMWRHIGDQGTVYFPYHWLDSSPRSFYDAKLYTSGPYFEYAFKSIARLANPKWKEREKDKIALAYLTKKIQKEGLEPEALLKSIWSYNPFWIQFGYSPFDKPVLVCPRQ